MTVADGEPCFTPHVPASWGLLRFRVYWRRGWERAAEERTERPVTPPSAGGQESWRRQIRRLVLNIHGLVDLVLVEGLPPRSPQ